MQDLGRPIHAAIVDDNHFKPIYQRVFEREYSPDTLRDNVTLVINWN